MKAKSSRSGKGKGLIRSMNRRGTRVAKRTFEPLKTRHTPGPTVCHRCGSIFANKTWRREDRRASLAFFENAQWVLCPACTQASRAEGFGRVVLHGAYVAANEDAIRRRIQNVAARAEFTQPQRRVSSITRVAGGLEVLTTSQKLAHRIAHELKKAFHGRTTYSWSDRDGALFATWERDDVPETAGALRGRR